MKCFVLSGWFVNICVYVCTRLYPFSCEMGKVLSVHQFIKHRELIIFPCLAEFTRKKILQLGP